MKKPLLHQLTKATLLLLIVQLTLTSFAQKSKKNQVSIPVSTPTRRGNVTVNDSLFNALKWRNIGPFRSGRVLAVAGHADQPLVYYFGAVGGGVWKTIDAGANWFPISDSTFHSSSVGAIAVAPSDPNVLYVGMGEGDMRSNISYGDGVYKSTDAGKTWKHVGLPKADAISNIEIHPTNPDVAYVASVGNPFAPNPERGVFRTTDGGKSWKQILSKNDSTGAVMVRLDPNNPRIVYASMWQAYRNGYSMSSGGKGCGLYKSTDGGDTWENLSQKPGMPKGVLGKIGIAVAASNSNRLFALVENAKGGLFRSDDGGEHWTLINDDKNLWQRCWYYMDLEIDPKNENNLIVLNVNAMKSNDGGKTFKRIMVHHGDTHDCWINPKNPDNYIIGDDGGAEVTFNGGATFSDVDVPTAQFYHVSLDNDFPYNVYGAQQDNSSVRIASRTDGSSIDDKAWYPVAGGEAGYIAADPINSKITYGGEYDGQMSQHNAETGETRDVAIWPESAIGAPSIVKKYRFQWTYPIVFSPHNPKELYITSNYVHVTTNAGYSWETISPDLTRNDPKTLGETGGPITKDMTGAEIYGTIFTFAESALEKGNFWTGSDDGLVHVTKDGGKNWENISLPTTQLPDYSLISLIAPSEFDKGKAYLAANKYMFGDRTPYLFKTTDYGKTWTKITNGIPNDEYCRVVREDPNKRGLLYAGTERGIYVSFSDGATWQKLNLNLPQTPIRDLQVHKREKDLVVATHGRAFWVLDDISPLHEIMDGKVKEEAFLYPPRPSYLMNGGARPQRPDADAGENVPLGVQVRYFLVKKPSKELKLQFLTEKGDTVNTYSNIKDKKGEVIKISKDFYEDNKQPKPGAIPANLGMNNFVWNFSYPDATEVDGTNVMWAGSIAGAIATPGMYKVRLIDDNKLIAEQPFEIKKDPRLKVTDGELKEQFELVQKVNKKVTECHKTINQIRKIKASVSGYLGAIKDTALVSKLKKVSQPMIDSLEVIESSLMQTKAKAPQDVLAYPIRLNDKMAGVANYVMSNGFGKPNKQHYAVYEDLAVRIDKVIARYKEIKDKKVPEFNDLVNKEKIQAISLDEKGK
jgi:photosystem II stability/assembly factor-like uncharacterized protein